MSETRKRSITARAIIPAKTRKGFRIDKSLGVIAWDEDNLYPNRVLEYAKSSGTADSCSDLLRKFIFGGGFSDESTAARILNDLGETGDDLLEAVSRDFGLLGSVLWIGYNALGEISEVRYIPVEYFRYKSPEKETDPVTDGVIYDDWTQQKRALNKRLIKAYPLFTPDRSKVLDQIAKFGGVSQYPGQLLFMPRVKVPVGEYPLAVFDSVIDEVVTEASLSVFKSAKTSSGFNASSIFVNKGKREGTEKTAAETALEEFVGPEAAGSIIYLEAEEESQVPEIIEIKDNFNEKIFTTFEESTSSKIIRRFGPNPILVSTLVPGKLGTSEEINEAILEYNFKTRDYRLALSRYFKTIYDRLPDASTLTDVEIEPFGLMDTGLRLPKESISSVTTILSSNMDPQAKRGALKVLFKLTDEELDLIAPKQIPA